MLNAKEGHYMYVDNLGVVVISTNKQLLSELFSGISFKGLVALATLSEIETLETDLHYLKGRNRYSVRIQVCGLCHILLFMRL